MSAAQVLTAFQSFVGRSGEPLESGSVYIGIDGLNPQTNPVQVYWDEALTAPAAQPIRTVAGYPVNGNAPARLYVDATSVSVALRDRTGSLVWSAMSVPVLQEINLAFIGALLYPRTASEIAAAVTPTSFAYPEGDLRRYGGVEGGVVDNSTAWQKAVNVGLIYVPRGSWRVDTQATKAGRITMRGEGPDSVVLSDSNIMTITSGDGSTIQDIELRNITAPWIITRDPSNFGAAPAVVLATLQQSNADGYQPTVNDTDIWASLTAGQQNQQIGPVINITGNDMVVSGITGRFVRIAVTGNRNLVRDCSFRGGKGTFAAIEITNLGTTAGNYNKVVNCHVRYASFCGITVINQADALIEGCTVELCGESGIKTSQGSGFSCVRTRIGDCTSTKNYYDGLDTASRFPLDASQDTRNQVCNNRASSNYRNGMNVDGQNNMVLGNSVHDNGLMGVWCLANTTKIHGNNLIGNNYRLSASDHHLVGGGTNNNIQLNFISGNNASSGIFADGTNIGKNNELSGVTAFFGNPGSIPSVVEGNVDATSGFQTEQSFRLTITNTGGTIQHAIDADGTGNASFFSSRITGASTTLTNTPTGADAGTAFGTGGKISSASTNRFILNTAAQNSPRLQFSAVIVFNDTTTALNVEVITTSRNVNGATVVRPELVFTGDPAGAAFNLTTIGVGKFIRLRCTGRLA